MKLLRSAAIETTRHAGQPVALSSWSGWCGEGARIQQDREIEAILGQSIADSTKKLYTGSFRKWEIYRGIQEKHIYLSTNETDARAEEDSIPEFSALHLGHWGKTTPRRSGI